MCFGRGTFPPDSNPVLESGGLCSGSGARVPARVRAVATKRSEKKQQSNILLGTRDAGEAGMQVFIVILLLGYDKISRA